MLKLDTTGKTASNSTQIHNLVPEFRNETELLYDKNSKNLYCFTPKCGSSNWKRLSTAIHKNWTFEELRENEDRRKVYIYYVVPSFHQIHGKLDRLPVEDGKINHR